MARGTHGEGGGQAHGRADSDEVLEGVFGSCPAIPTRRCHGECEILRPVPDRDATGPRVPPLGSGRQRVHRLLPVLRTADPGTWTSAGGEGATRRPGFHRHDDARDAARTGGGLRRAAAPNLQAGRIDALHRLRDRGDPPRGPHRPRLPTPTDDRKIRGALPRGRRRVPRQSRAVGRGGEARPRGHLRLPGNARACLGEHPRPAVQ